MSLNKFTKELNGERVEGELVKTVFYSLIVSFVLIAGLYFLALKNVPGFIDKYGFYLFFSAISYSLMLPAVRQIRAYRQFGCMSGMMIGMTIGMIFGFMSGYYIGATNGMFVGAMFGMAVGILFGIWTGSCCGIMGMMEGIMAGFMGGLMGAMTSVMLLNEPIKIATIVIALIVGVISIGLNYMIFTEMKENERQRKEDHLFTIIVSFVLTVVTTWLMVYGPRFGALA